MGVDEAIHFISNMFPDNASVASLRSTFLRTYGKDEALGNQLCNFQTGKETISFSI